MSMDREHSEWVAAVRAAADLRRSMLGSRVRHGAGTTGKVVRVEAGYIAVRFEDGHVEQCHPLSLSVVSR